MTRPQTIEVDPYDPIESRAVLILAAMGVALLREHSKEHSLGLETKQLATFFMTQILPRIPEPLKSELLHICNL